MNKFLITTALTTILLGCGTVSLGAEKDLKCSIIEETDTYIQKNCVDKNGKVISASIESKPMPGITIVKSDEGTPQVKVNVEKFVDERGFVNISLCQSKSGKQYFKLNDYKPKQEVKAADHSPDRDDLPF